jgi:hypothetical protein
VDDVLRARAAAETVLIKRLFGFAGRGQLRLAPGPVDPAARAFLERALREDDAVTVEPWLERTGDFALHGYLASDGVCTLGDPTVQEISPRGVWRATRRAGPDDLVAGESERLVALARAAAKALRGAGFHGPFGLDALRFGGPGGSPELVRCELNARYTMGWALGMGGKRPDLAERG